MPIARMTDAAVLVDDRAGAVFDLPGGVIHADGRRYGVLITRPNTTVRMLGDLTIEGVTEAGLVIDADCVTFDGNGHYLSVEYWRTGFDLEQCLMVGEPLRSGTHLHDIRAGWHRYSVS